VSRGDRSVRRQTNSKRFDHTSHCRCGAHSHAVTCRTAHTRLRVHEVAHAHNAATNVFAELPDIGARAYVLSPILAIQHWASRNHQGWKITACGAHQKSGSSLVTTCKQHYAVERIGADCLFDIHADQVAEQHRGRPHQRLAERHHRKLERKAASLVHATLHVICDPPKVRVAGRQL